MLTYYVTAVKKQGEPTRYYNQDSDTLVDELCNATFYSTPKEASQRSAVVHEYLLATGHQIAKATEIMSEDSSVIERLTEISVLMVRAGAMVKLYVISAESEKETHVT